jgi:hypothetical protein
VPLPSTPIRFRRPMRTRAVPPAPADRADATSEADPAPTATTSQLRSAHA